MSSRLAELSSFVFLFILDFFCHNILFLFRFQNIFNRHGQDEYHSNVWQPYFH